MGEVIAFADVVLRRRRRVARQLHARCLEILEASVVAARRELPEVPIMERPVRVARLRKLQDLHAYALMLA